MQADPPPSPERSFIMSRVGTKDTGPELALRRLLWARGARFRCHARRLPGTPDLSNARARVAVFVDGCFWHGCPRHFRVPKTRADFWGAKIERNRARREAVRAAYPAGWRVFEVYACRLREVPDAVADEVAAALAPPPQKPRTPQRDSRRPAARRPGRTP